ncbi:hypothetical protein BKA69DRAFT_597618 [Paraphysoderma sedebokerense]|nr:hypothetical protein BKA69DRAFT_597618 [Paraphysoderma sedebokerense]
MKSIGNEKPMVMITVNETLFIQFPFCDEQNAALCVEKIRSLQRGHIPNEENDSATNIPSFITNNHPESFEALIQRERDSKMQAIEDEYRVKLRELQQAKDRKIQELRSRENSQVISKLQSDDLLDIVKANLSSEVGDCQLCYDSTESKVILPCHHRLCSSCAEKLIETSSKCPWDRNEFEKIVELGKPCEPQPH